jgi:hypothetical protein
MSHITPKNGHIDTALAVTFSPIVLGFIIGALPVLVPILVIRGLSRLIGGHAHSHA